MQQKTSRTKTQKFTKKFIKAFGVNETSALNCKPRSVLRLFLEPRELQ